MEPKTEWDRGHALKSHQVMLDWVLKDPGIIIEEAKYFHADLRLAGKVTGVLPEGGKTLLVMKPTGTTSEELLKYCTGVATPQLRIHVCNLDCNQEEIAEDLVHARKLRKMGSDKAEEAWTTNLEGVRPAPPDDELQLVREQLKAHEAEKEAKDKKKSQSRSPSKKRKKNKRGKDKKKKEEEVQDVRSSKRKGNRQEEGCEGVRGTIQLRPRTVRRVTATASSHQAPSCHLRRRGYGSVREGARKSCKRSTSLRQAARKEEIIQQPLFEQRLLGRRHPGGRRRDLQRGHEVARSGGWVSRSPFASCSDRNAGIPPTDRRGRRLAGPDPGNCRAILSAAAAKAHLWCRRKRAAYSSSGHRHDRQRPSDTVTRLAGTEIQEYRKHSCQISKKMELLPSETPAIAELSEVKDARREVHEENKTRWMGYHGDQKGNQNKNGGKGKAGNKDDRRWNEKGEAKGGRQGKGDAWKKDEGVPKSGRPRSKSDKRKRGPLRRGHSRSSGVASPEHELRRGRDHQLQSGAIFPRR